MAKALADLPEKWFAEHGVTDPAAAAREWEEWLAKRAGRSPRARLKKALQLATGLHEASIRHYLDRRSYKLGAETLEILDGLTAALGFEPPRRAEREPAPGKSPVRAVRIALVAELQDIPSPPYHLEVIRGVVRRAASHRFSAALHGVIGRDMRPAIERIVRAFRPDGVVMVRLTPTAECLALLRRARVPVVLVHANRFRYPAPVLTNIVPVQRPIKQTIRAWAERLPGRRSGRTTAQRSGQREIAVITMPDEQVAMEFGKIPGVEPSIRNERIRLIMQGLTGLAPVRFVVQDYSFRHALAALQAHPEARAYVCLSDQIAAGMKHLLAVQHPKGHRRAIIGFDDSDLATEERITSFGQHLDELGELATEALGKWFERRTEPEAEWPEFRETPTDVHLTVRE